MKKISAIIILLPAFVQVMAQNSGNPSSASDTMSEIILPILFIGFLVFMLITLIKYFLEFRLKSKLIDRGMSEQLSAYILNKSDREKQHEAMKLAILFFGIGAGLTLTYWTAPIHLHSLAIMACSIGLSYLAYFFYLRR